MEEKDNIIAKKAKNILFKKALCYLPLIWAIIVFFMEKEKTPDLNKHIKYWFAMFVVYIVLNLFLPSFLAYIWFFVYVWMSSLFAYKIYNWKDVNIKYFDDFEEVIKKKM